METTDIAEYIIAYIQGTDVIESNEQQRDVRDALGPYLDYTDRFIPDTSGNDLKYYDAIFYPRDAQQQENLVKLRSYLTYSTISLSLIRAITDENTRLLLLSILRGINLAESITSV